jgi:hypothetical protein
MSELFTYGSVGGAGRKPGPYPAVDAPITRPLTIVRQRAARH